MSVEKLERVFTQIDNALSHAQEQLESWDGEGEELGNIATGIRQLGDTLDQRVSTLPKKAEHVRLSRFNIALLGQVLRNWSDRIEKLAADADDFSESAEKAGDELGKETAKFDKAKDEVFKLLEGLSPTAPELDIKSELIEAERVPI